MDYVYLIRADLTPHRYKIGISYQPEKRLTQLETASPVRLNLLHTIATKEAKELERKLHLRFYMRHHHAEWFDLTDDDVKYITNLTDIDEYIADDNEMALYKEAGIDYDNKPTPSNIKDCGL